MEKIFYAANEYQKLYEHEKGGSYYVSTTAPVVTSWLDVYPDGSVMFLWDGTLSYLGYLVGNQVVRSNDVNRKE